jgi:hypothetical protein
MIVADLASNDRPTFRREYKRAWLDIVAAFPNPAPERRHALADAVRVFSDPTLPYGMRQSGALASRHVAFFIDFRYTKSAICMTPSPQAIFDQGRSFCHRRHGCHWRR